MYAISVIHNTFMSMLIVNVHRLAESNANPKHSTKFHHRPTFASQQFHPKRPK
jgi:hypothetical protein